MAGFGAFGGVGVSEEGLLSTGCVEGRGSARAGAGVEGAGDPDAGTDCRAGISLLSGAGADLD